jgi:hypothetical protein
MVDISKITIDYPNAGEYTNDDPRFIEELRLLHVDLAVPGAIKRACIHEVGHLLYARMFSAISKFAPEEFWFLGPAVTYGLIQTNEYQFDHYVAATRLPFTPDDLNYTDEKLLALAKACFAGGVFVHELDEPSRRGDIDDVRKFHRYYKSAIKKRGQMGRLESTLKRLATAAVTSDLRHEAVREKALTHANYLETKYFS